MGYLLFLADESLIVQVKEIVKLLILWLKVDTPVKVCVLNSIFQLKSCPVNQPTRERVPVGDHVEPIDSYKQISMLLPHQVIILIELLELSSPLEQGLLEHLDLP